MGLTVASPPTSPSRPKEDVEIGLLSDHHNTPTSLAIAAGPGPAAKHLRRSYVLIGTLLLISCLLGLLLGRDALSASHEGSRFSDEPQNSSLLNVLVVGDWGREGNYNQSAVAYQMGMVGDLLGPEFIISTGDNFYEDGLTGVNDTAFYKSFTQIYTAQSLQKTWHVVLGNHDYRGDALAQLDRQLTIEDSRWHCEIAFSVRHQLCESSKGSASYVDFFFYDTNPFVEKYWTDTDNVYDWRGVLPKQEYLDKQKEFLASGLESSSATWKIVIGHHPIRSVGEHGDTRELDSQILPILEANNVDLYLNGHDHCLEHIIGNGIQYLTSGGGSKAWRGIDSSANMSGLQFYYDGQGFLSLSISSSQLHFSFYDALGNTLHQGQLSKA